jgi:hypothetical protein
VTTEGLADFAAVLIPISALNCCRQLIFLWGFTITDTFGLNLCANVAHMSFEEFSNETHLLAFDGFRQFAKNNGHFDFKFMSRHNFTTFCPKKKLGMISISHFYCLESLSCLHNEQGQQYWSQ